MLRSKTKPALMKLRPVAIALGAAAFALAGFAAAQSASFASSTEVVLPLAVNISVYKTKAFVLNPNPGPIAVNVLYYQSNNGTAPAGLRPCTQLNLQGNQSASFDMGSQCGLNSTDDNFGMMILQDAAQTNEFFAYSRTDTSDGLGFSVEGFPIENFSGAKGNVLGLQNLAAAPNYRSNCFVSSFANAVNWQVQLVQGGTESVLGTVSGHLEAFQTTRILDVFTAAGLSGDYSNVRATFSTTDVSQPAYMGFCTLETSSNGSADFRIAKSMTPLPPPPGNLTLAATFNGTIQTLLNGTGVYEFIGQTSLTLGSATTVSAYGGGLFAKQSSGVGSVSLGMCSQDQNGPGPITVLASPTTVSVNGTNTFHSASGSGTLPAATYTIGLCAQNLGTNSVNKNGASSGYIFTSP